QCGFKLFETAAARQIFGRQRLDGFGFDVEVLFIAKRLGYRTVEVPVRWNDVAGTKVSMALGAMGFLDPLKVRWNGLMGKYRTLDNKDPMLTPATLTELSQISNVRDTISAE